MPDAVAIQGEAGSFSHAAAIETHGPGLQLVPCTTFVDLFRAVETGDASRGVVPIENTLAGSVHENYDLLSAHELHVVAETELRIRHCLIAPPRTALDAIHRVEAGGGVVRRRSARRGVGGSRRELHAVSGDRP